MDITAPTAEHMLDTLAEYQSEADYLEIQKRELLDAVKIPDEVLEVQDEANKKRQAIDDQCRKELDTIQALCDAEMGEVVVPPEIVAAYRAIEARKNEIGLAAIKKRATVLAEAQARRNAVDADLQSKTTNVYNQIEIRKSEIIAEFEYKGSSVKDNIAKLTAEIKATVKTIGKTVKGQFYQAVYVKGRVTWNTDILDGMMIAIPELVKARKEGEPSITLRANK